MKRILLVIFLFAITVYVIGQQDPLYSQYMFDKMAINPASTGSSNIMSVNATYRNQFMGIEGAPVTEKLTFQYPFQAKYMGVGLKAYHDQAGVTKTTAISGIYSYHVGFGSGKLSFGLEAGILNGSYNYTDLIRADEGDQVIDFGVDNVLLPDAGFGTYYHNDRMYLGVSSFHLFAGKVNPSGFDHSPIYKLSRHHFAYGGYYIDFTEKFGVEPSFLIKTVGGAPVQTDLNLNLIYNDMIAMGTSYRTGDGLSFLMRLKIKDMIVLGYSYDYRLTELATYSKGSHEIMISYRVGLLPPARQKVTDPRYYF